MENSEKMKVTYYETLGQLPDPFLFNDGTRVKTPEDWRRRRRELIATAVELQYGVMPPEPEFLEVETLYNAAPGKLSCYRVTTATRACPVSFILYIYRPDVQGKCPVIVDGDGCYRHPHIHSKMFNDNGIMYAFFNRTEIVPDMRGIERNSPIHRAYPDIYFSTIMAWAWGYLRTVDALIKLGFIDEEHIAFTGLSRGAKTAMVAGALDERAWIVNPEAPCAGGSLYRSRMRAITEDGEEKRSEELEDITKAFPDWFTPEMQTYRGRVNELPFDEHELKALVAPRIFFDSEAISDIWAGPIQAYQSDVAAREVYSFLGAPDNILWYWRSGYHEHNEEDYRMLLNLILNRLRGEPLNEKFNRIPFDEPEMPYSWKAPE